METTKNFAAITSKLGVQIDTTTYATQVAAERAAQKAIKSGTADQAAVWDANGAISFFGRR